MAQINTTVGDLEGNTAKILDYIQQARAQQADLVAFPEMAITGYPPEDLIFQPSFIQANIQKMHQVVAQTQGITVVVGFVNSQGDIHNAAAVAHDCPSAMRLSVVVGGVKRIACTSKINPMANTPALARRRPRVANPPARPKRLPRVSMPKIAAAANGSST